MFLLRLLAHLILLFTPCFLESRIQNLLFELGRHALCMSRGLRFLQNSFGAGGISETFPCWQYDSPAFTETHRANAVTFAARFEDELYCWPKLRS